MCGCKDATASKCKTLSDKWKGFLCPHSLLKGWGLSLFHLHRDRNLGLKSFVARSHDEQSKFGKDAKLECDEETPFPLHPTSCPFVRDPFATCFFHHDQFVFPVS